MMRDMRERGGGGRGEGEGRERVGEALPNFDVELHHTEAFHPRHLPFRVLFDAGQNISLFRKFGFDTKNI